MDGLLYFYGSNEDLMRTRMIDLLPLYVGDVVAADDHLYDQTIEFKHIYTFSSRLGSSLVSEYGLVYIGSLEELL